jgi:predicted MarR family transcription regulator
MTSHTDDSKPANQTENSGELSIDKWRCHLASSADEAALTDLELTLFRTYIAFDNWQHLSQSTVAGNIALNKLETMILNMIRIRERPKSIPEIALVLNRDDVPNLQYALRKMEKMDLIKRYEDENRKNKKYVVTELGLELTEKHAELRRSLLTSMVTSVSDWKEQAEKASQLMNILLGMYEQASAMVTFHVGEQPDS